MGNNKILNFDLVSISSLSGFQCWGEFSDLNSMITKLEDLRKTDEIHATNSSVLITGFIKTKSGIIKKAETYRLSYLDGKWVIILPQ